MISGKVIDKTLAPSNDIKVTIEYTLTDNSTLTLNNYYSFINYSEAKVLDDIKNKCEYLMQQYYTKQQNTIIANQSISNIEYECTGCNMVIQPAEYNSYGILITPAVIIPINDITQVVGDID